MAYYMLGRAHMARKQYAAAVYALVKCRNLHQAQATSDFANMQEAERLRRERIQDLERLISELRQAVPQTFRIQEQVRQFEERKRQIQDLDRNRGLDSTKAVPAFVSLSLGSAYFRLDDLARRRKRIWRPSRPTRRSERRTTTLPSSTWKPAGSTRPPGH